MKIFPWGGWGHWLIFSSSFVQVLAFSRVGGGGGGGGFTLTGALNFSCKFHLNDLLFYSNDFA